MLFFLFSRRKWLPTPLRKLSQGKVDKTTVAERPLVKKGSEKTFKLADKLSTSTTAEEEPLATYKSIPTTSANVTSQSGQSDTVTHADLEAEEEVALELPPPMKPIQDSQSMMNNGPTVSSSSTVEQSPCKRVRLCGQSIKNSQHKIRFSDFIKSIFIIILHIYKLET